MPALDQTDINIIKILSKELIPRSVLNSTLRIIKVPPDEIGPRLERLVEAGRVRCQGDSCWATPGQTFQSVDQRQEKAERTLKAAGEKLAAESEALLFVSAEKGGVEGLRQRQQQIWDEKHQQLAAFFELHGHSDVPMTAGKNQHPLKNWVCEQRRAKKNGRLSQERIARLDKLNFSWDLAGDSWPVKVAEYRQELEAGTLGPEGVAWLERCRAQWQSGKLTPARRKSLVDAGLLTRRGNLPAELAPELHAEPVLLPGGRICVTYGDGRRGECVTLEGYQELLSYARRLKQKLL